MSEYIDIIKANKPLQRLMVADCADYETYRSGKFIPGIMGTLFSLVDKLVSSGDGEISLEIRYLMFE